MSSNLPTAPVHQVELDDLPVINPRYLDTVKGPCRWEEGDHTVVRDATGFIFVVERPDES